MIKYLQLPVCFDVQPMLNEISHFPGIGWKMHYNKKHYEGDWSIIALRSPGGDPGNIFAIQAAAMQQGHQPYIDTDLLRKCPSINKTLQYFECEKTMVRLMKLNAGAIIKEHADHDLFFEAGEVRFHIPLQTNEQVDFFLDNEKMPMKEGQCWYMNLNLNHRVANEGTTDRIHLVIDCIVNDWIKTQFSLLGIYKKEMEDKAPVNYSKETRSQIISSLRLLNTAVSNEMARKMEAGNE